MDFFLNFIKFIKWLDMLLNMQFIKFVGILQLIHKSCNLTEFAYKFMTFANISSNSQMIYGSCTKDILLILKTIYKSYRDFIEIANIILHLLAH